jgi:hypothetical protein
MTQEELIRTIEQRLEDLMVFDEELVYQYECDLYYFDENDGPIEPIKEMFTPELLKEIEKHIEELDQ